MGFNLDEIKDKHLVSEGMDMDMGGTHFSSSIPMATAIDPANEVILAYGMNG